MELANPIVGKIDYLFVSVRVTLMKMGNFKIMNGV